jgi:hypothetical protein
MRALEQYPDLTTGYRADVASDAKRETLDAGPSLACHHCGNVPAVDAELVGEPICRACFDSISATIDDADASLGVF